MNNLPITNKELWKPLAATYYIVHENNDYESIKLKIFYNVTNVDDITMLTVHTITRHSNIYHNPANIRTDGFEGITLSWKNNPFRITI